MGKGGEKPLQRSSSSSSVFPMDEKDSITSWRCGYVDGDGQVSLEKGQGLLIQLIKADPQIFIDRAPDVETTIAFYLLNTHTQVANVMPLDGLKSQDIEAAQALLRQEYPDYKVDIQESHFPICEAIRSEMSSQKGDELVLSE